MQDLSLLENIKIVFERELNDQALEYVTETALEQINVYDDAKAKHISLPEEELRQTAYYISKFTNESKINGFQGINSRRLFGIYKFCKDIMTTVRNERRRLDVDSLLVWMAKAATVVQKHLNLLYINIGKHMDPKDRSVVTDFIKDNLKTLIGNMINSKSLQSDMFKSSFTSIYTLVKTIEQTNDYDLMFGARQIIESKLNEFVTLCEDPTSSFFHVKEDFFNFVKETLTSHATCLDTIIRDEPDDLQITMVDAQNTQDQEGDVGNELDIVKIVDSIVKSPINEQEAKIEFFRLMFSHMDNHSEQIEYFATHALKHNLPVQYFNVMNLIFGTEN